MNAPRHPDLPPNGPGVPQAAENAVAGPADGKASMSDRGFGKTMICGTCLFWRSNEDRSYGECRYNPPTSHIDLSQETGIAIVWPDTEPSDWCGKWLPAPHAQPWVKEDRP